MTLTFDIWSSLQRHPRTAISTTVEDSDEEEEEDDEVDSHSCMEDEASASKFFFSSPMSYKGDEACLLMHESHALSNAQEGRGDDGILPLQLSAHPLPSLSALKNHVSCGDVVSETLKNHVGYSDVVSETLVKGKENLGAVTLSVGTIPLAVPFQSSPSKFNVKEHDGLTVVPARSKEKIGADVPSIQLSAAVGGSNGGCSSSSHAKEMDGNGFTSSPTNDVGNNGPKDSDKLGNMAAKSGKWKALFSSNHSAENGTQLVHFSELNNASSCSLLEHDLGNLKDVWKYCIVGYVAGKFPGFKALNHIIVNSWKCKASLTIHESGWLVYRFLHEEDKLAVLSGGPYLVYGRPLILKSMPEFFDFSTADMSTVPVWIKLPNLPLQCWSPVCLSKIGSVLGKPVQCDVLTSSMSRLSFARILVEIDLLEDLKHSVKLELPNGTSVNQKIIYETLPRYCKHCRVIGHNTSLYPHSFDKKVASAPMTVKVVEAVEKGLVKRWVPVKKVIPDQFRPNDMQVPSPLNESLDEQRVDPMQMETDAGEWTVVKRRNRKSKVANDNAVVLSSLGDPVSMVGIDVDPLCGVTTRSGIRRSGDLARSKGLKALAPMKKGVDVFGLLESKLSAAKVANMQKFRLKNWKFLSNAEVAGTYARVIVFWNPSSVSVDLIASSAQGLHVSICSLVHQASFTATFVYGFNTVVARRTLWNDLRSWDPCSPWMILGDFNAIMPPADKHNGEPVTSYETSDFLHCCSDPGLADVNYSGSHFTWSNGRIWTKIDRVLVNHAWPSFQCPIQVHYDSPGPFSDHSPAVIRLGSSHVMGRRSFKFYNMWGLHKNFIDLTAASWNLEVYGSPMFVLCSKLKRLKLPLKELGKHHFSHISERVSSMEAGSS
ncbi:hypothetical protein OIU76_020828 [Salix suchowensis]|nr:hypothetical protein OIU76_020828 [Salix suchowensis]